MNSIFLSHAGIDAAAAAALKRRLESAFEVRQSESRVWFDKDDLQGGPLWQQQLESAIDKSSGFVVYVGSRGILNWVEMEVRVALSKAVHDKDFPFITILSKECPGSHALPAFARQFQSVRDVEGDPQEFDKLVSALLDAEQRSLAKETEPFFGLSSIPEDKSHLFFGRSSELQELVSRVARLPFVMVVGDSGSGKSSLVHAGLVNSFLGGAIAFSLGERPSEEIWHVVSMRPRSDPLAELGDAVAHAARKMGKPETDCESFARAVMSGDVSEVRRALRCGLDHDRIQTLLVVDQFEELFTSSSELDRKKFATLLENLLRPDDLRIRVVATMRSDYVNLCSDVPQLRRQIDSSNRLGRMMLGSMSPDALRDVVRKPLILAGIEKAEAEAFTQSVLTDVSQRPGDLALLQMALSETWHVRKTRKQSLFEAYVTVGRVEGALAQAAEHVRLSKLSEDESELLFPALVRLIRLGETGGATRRVAAVEEFEVRQWKLLQKLSSKECRRLVLIGGSDDRPTVEIAHESIVTAWPWFQNSLQAVAAEKRILESLMPKASSWTAASTRNQADRILAVGADLDLFRSLAESWPTWLSAKERTFVAESVAKEERESRSRRRSRQFLFIAGGVTIVLLLSLSLFAFFSLFNAVAARNDAENATKQAQKASTEAERARLSERRGRIITLADRYGTSVPDRSLALVSSLAEENGAADPKTWEAMLRELYSTPSITKIIWTWEPKSYYIDDEDRWLTLCNQADRLAVLNLTSYGTLPNDVPLPANELCRSTVIPSSGDYVYVLTELQGAASATELARRIEERREQISAAAQDRPSAASELTRRIEERREQMHIEERRVQNRAPDLGNAHSIEKATDISLSVQRFRIDKLELASGSIVDFRDLSVPAKEPGAPALELVSLREGIAVVSGDGDDCFFISSDLKSQTNCSDKESLFVTSSDGEFRVATVVNGMYEVHQKTGLLQPGGIKRFRIPSAFSAVREKPQAVLLGSILAVSARLANDETNICFLHSSHEEIDVCRTALSKPSASFGGHYLLSTGYGGKRQVWDANEGRIVDTEGHFTYTIGSQTPGESYSDDHPTVGRPTLALNSDGTFIYGQYSLQRELLPRASPSMAITTIGPKSESLTILNFGNDVPNELRLPPLSLPKSKDNDAYVTSSETGRYLMYFAGDVLRERDLETNADAPLGSPSPGANFFAAFYTAGDKRVVIEEGQDTVSALEAQTNSNLKVLSKSNCHIEKTAQDNQPRFLGFARNLYLDQLAIQCDKEGVGPSLLLSVEMRDGVLSASAQSLPSQVKGSVLKDDAGNSFEGYGDWNLPVSLVSGSQPNWVEVGPHIYCSVSLRNCKKSSQNQSMSTPMGSGSNRLIYLSNNVASISPSLETQGVISVPIMVGDGTMIEHPRRNQMSRDGNTIVVGSRHGILLMRGQANAIDRSQVATVWIPVRESVYDVLLSGDGNVLTFISDEKVVQLNLSVSELIKKARSIVNSRNTKLTETELAEYR